MQPTYPVFCVILQWSLGAAPDSAVTMAKFIELLWVGDGCGGAQPLLWAWQQSRRFETIPGLMAAVVELRSHARPGKEVGGGEGEDRFPPVSLAGSDLTLCY